MKKVLIPSIMVAVLAIAGCAAEAPVEEEVVTEEVVEETPEAPVEEEAAGDIVAVASGAGSFTTLVAAVEAAGLVETLQGVGPFTVFAPTDEAFAALPAGLLDALLLEENREILVQILTYHVVSGTVLAADVTEGDVASVEGSAISITVGDGVVLNGTANVTATDVVASNGVIHVIDAVILPPGLDVSSRLG
jgi:uncharacterized surface protein with fasciclin (FAS1) repeats